MRQSVYLKEETKEYIQEYASKHDTTISNAIALLIEEHKALKQQVQDLSKQVQENKDLVALYTRIKDNMVKLYDYIKNNVTNS